MDLLSTPVASVASSNRALPREKKAQSQFGVPNAGRSSEKRITLIQRSALSDGAALATIKVKDERGIRSSKFDYSYQPVAERRNP